LWDPSVEGRLVGIYFTFMEAKFLKGTKYLKKGVEILL
jgi:hypothetical protein